jgi:hypothetical protein
MKCQKCGIEIKVYSDVIKEQDIKLCSRCEREKDEGDTLTKEVNKEGK